MFVKFQIWLWFQKYVECLVGDHHSESTTTVYQTTILNLTILGIPDVIEKAMREVFSVSEDKEVRLWNKYMSNTYEQLGGKGPEHTVQDAGLYQGQVIVLEQKNEDGSWPRHAAKV